MRDGFFVLSKRNNLVKMSIFATGLFLAVSFGLLDTQTLHAQTSCHQLTSASAIPNGFSAAYNVHSSARDLLISGACAASEIAVTVGVGSESHYIYEESYVWSGTQWQKVLLSGTKKVAPWLVGSAQATISQTQDQSSEHTFYVAYVCVWTGVWKCGCRDSACATPNWQLQAFQKAQSGATGNTSGNTTGTATGNTTGGVSSGSKPNIIVIMSDDQRADSLWAMPKLKTSMMNSGVTFEKAFMTTALCCPVRASILSGGYYVQDTGVLENYPPNGGAGNFKDSNTLGTNFAAAGYQTAYMGKYLNQYDDLAPYVPPGWSWWRVNVKGADASNWGDFEVVEGASTPTQAKNGTRKRIQQYHTEYLRDQALSFIRDATGKNKPYFLFVSTFAPHSPATPAAGDTNLFTDYLFRGPAFRETDMSDKPIWMQNDVVASAYRINGNDTLHRNQLRSLQALDRLIEDVVNEVARQGQTNNTVIFFFSDNGFLWGEHNLDTKYLPYEEVVRVPFVVKAPSAKVRTDSSALVAVNLDLGATLYSLAGINRFSEGKNLLPLIRGEKNTHWSEILIENFSIPVYLRNNGVEDRPWVAVRTDRYKYVKWPAGSEELYDLASDPNEMQSVHTSAAYRTTLQSLKVMAEGFLGLAIITNQNNIPQGSVGTSYSVSLRAWGGTEPYTWTLFKGSFPPGLSMTSQGIIRGTPSKRGSYTFSVKVHDVSTRKHAGGNQQFVSEFKIEVK